eukprot:14120233-Ditylum_brightwellii.AAC.2
MAFLIEGWYGKECGGRGKGSVGGGCHDVDLLKVCSIGHLKFGSKGPVKNWQLLASMHVHT